MPTVSHVTFLAHGDPPLKLEGLLHRTEAGTPPVGFCVLLHPHAIFRGSMDTWLLSRVAHRLAEDGWTVLRFNFRGVGASEGTSGDGTGELHDVVGALAFLDKVAGLASAEEPSHRVAVVGWSFGALVGLLLAEHQVRVTDWVGIGPPTRRLNAITIVDPPYRALPGWPARRCVIVGEFDELYPPRSVAVLDPDVVHVMPGADHFMADRDDEVADVVSRALERDSG
ncbi:MAG: alpha/beta hydrolase [Egibacteraceae bacterium]